MVAKRSRRRANVIDAHYQIEPESWKPVPVVNHYANVSREQVKVDSCSTRTRVLAPVGVYVLATRRQKDGLGGWPGGGHRVPRVSPKDVRGRLRIFRSQRHHNQLRIPADPPELSTPDSRAKPQSDSQTHGYKE